MVDRTEVPDNVPEDPIEEAATPNRRGNLSEELPDRAPEEAMADLIRSIALEEAALAHLIRAEADKVTRLAEKCPPGAVAPRELLEFQRLLLSTLGLIIVKQQLLLHKLQLVAEFVSTLNHKPEVDEEG